MELPNTISKLLTGITPLDVIKSRLFQITILFILLFWLVDPAIDAFVFQEHSFTQQFLSPEPVEIYFRASITLLIALIGLISTLTLIRISKQQQALTCEREKLSQIIQHSPECVKTITRDGSLLEMNPAGLKIIDADSIDQVRGESVYDLIAPEYRQLFIDFNQRIFAGNTELIEYDIISLKGTRKSVESHAVPLRDGAGEVTSHLAMTRDVTQSRQQAKKLSYQASHDMLTGLINRHEFERRLENTLTLTATDQSTHAVLFIDLDQFKIINDTCGHMAGDQLLQQASNIMREQVRQPDCVARLGGDEFAILMQYCSLEDARNIANKLRLAIDEFTFPWEGRQFKLTASIGVAGVDKTDSCISDILRNADTACYLAKDMGRNRIQVHQKDDETTTRHLGEMRWISKIHAGIKEKRFILFAQIIESLNSQSPEQHVELLLRYCHEDGSISPPGAFLPAAERYGISPKLDRYVISTALGLLNNNPSLLINIDAFCINLSGLSLSDDDFLPFVIQQFDSYPSLPGKICFEITETAAISNMKNAGLFIEKLKSIGCRFALDDFGSGLSSFGYLKNLPVDYVKIDGCFVRGIINDPIDLAMVRSINDIGHLMGKKTIAEFVENDAIKQQLQQLGVDYVQGYGIGKPFPLQELIDDFLKLQEMPTKIVEEFNETPETT